MTTADRIKGVVAIGFTERQSRFLVLALRHGGICVPRQYAGLAGIAKAGRRCHSLFGRLVKRGHASTIDCNHNRARLYHIHSKALYSAIGEPTSLYRRAVSPRSAITRLMVLDAVLATPDVEWLTTDETTAHLAARCAVAWRPETRGSDSGEPSGASSERRQMFPVGVDSSGRTVLLFLATEPWTSGLRRFLARHLGVIRATPDWRVRLVFPRPLNGLGAQYLEAVREVLGTLPVRVEEHVECVTLPHFYRHLAPLVSGEPAVVDKIDEGVEEIAAPPSDGDSAPEPLVSTPSADAADGDLDEGVSEWQRLVDYAIPKKEEELAW